MADKKEEQTVVSTTLRYKLVSRLKYAHAIKLKGGENVFIPPHGTIESIDPDLLDTELPNGIHIVEFQA